MISIRQIPPPSPGRGTTEKNLKNSLWGVLPPNSTPDPHVPRNLRRAHRGAHDREKISEIGQGVAEKVEFEKKSLPPPGGVRRIAKCGMRNLQTSCDYHHSGGFGLKSVYTLQPVVQPAVRNFLNITHSHGSARVL